MNTSNIKQITERLDELKAQSIVVLNTSEKTIICDHMIICTVNGTRQMKFIANELLKENQQKRQFSDDEEQSWCLVDLGNIIVHIMTDDARVEIDLESLWADKK